MSPAQDSSKGQLCFGTGSLAQLHVPSHAQHRGAAGADSGWWCRQSPCCPTAGPGGAGYQDEHWRGSEFPGSAGLLKGRLSPPGAGTHTQALAPSL